MALIKTITVNELKQDMQQAGRDNFSHVGYQAIIDYYEELGENVEFNPVGIDCTFVEYDLSDSDDRQTILNDYGYLVEDQEFSDEDSKIEAIMDCIEEHTLVISHDPNCFVFDYNF